MGRRGKRHRGHFCWSCGRCRPNEKFSGKGHARHVCRECARLGGEELKLRSAERNMDGALDRDGRIRRRQRAFVERYLQHEDPRLRDYAARLLEADRQVRAEWRRMLEEEDRAAEAMAAAWGAHRLAAEVPDFGAPIGGDGEWELPF